MALGILANTGIRDLDADDPRALHLQIEAMKLAFRDTYAYVGDLGHMTGVSPEAMLDDGYLSERARRIDPGRAQDFGAGAPRQEGTVCLTAADASGMMVSFIPSNYMGFGSGVACETSVPAATLQALSDMGHVLMPEEPDASFGFGGAQSIRRLPGGGYAAGSDPRKDGLTVGF